jgi:RHS repeat-associated protein
LTQASSSNGAKYAYAYDPANNLTSIETPASGTENAAYNNLNQLVTLGRSGYTYDANGNVLDDGTRTYTWDAENRLLSVRFKAQPSRTTTFRYDGLSRRIAIVVTNGAISTETRYLWCGNVLCQARTANDAVSRRYFPEGELITASSASLLYGQDHLGSVRDVVAANGTRIASFDYNPHGGPARSTGRLSTDIRFAGMFYEQNSALYLTLYRAYDPTSARWISRDPIHEKGGINLYAYVAGNPINHVDQYGLCPPIDWSAVLAFGVVALVGVVAIVAIVATDGAAAPVVAELVESSIAETEVVAEEQTLVNSGSQVLANAAQGQAFEEEGVAYLENIQTDVQEQVSIRPYTESGDLADYRVRLDAVGTDESGNIQLTDFKSSETAGFTPNQQGGYPLLQQYGGEVVGNNGGLTYPAGTQIPPTQVTIIRPGLSGGYSVTPYQP